VWSTSGVLGTVGNTPAFALQRSTRTGSGRIVVKWERTNPAGSVKDRPALHLVELAERRGLLRPGGTIIESSSGNFGISLAMIGAARGYHVLVLVDPKATPANLKALAAYGAEVIVVTEQDDTGSYHKTRIARANELATKILGSFRPDQCFSLGNSDAHLTGTGPEITEEVGDPDVLVASVSTGGQLGGLSRYFRGKRSPTRLVGVDAEGSAIFGGDSNPYLVPGVGLGWTPTNLDLGLIDAAFKLPSELVFQACRALARHEGVLAGASSGAVYVVALHYALQLPPGATVLALLPDSGDRYLDTVFDEGWLVERGLSDHTPSIAELQRTATTVSPVRPLVPAVVPGLEDSLGVPESTTALNAELSGTGS
jgi:cystathionine beta-synthase/cysteine synthase A